MGGPVRLFVGNRGSGQRFAGSGPREVTRGHLLQCVILLSMNYESLVNDDTGKPALILKYYNRTKTIVLNVDQLYLNYSVQKRNQTVAFNSFLQLPKH